MSIKYNDAYCRLIYCRRNLCSEIQTYDDICITSFKTRKAMAEVRSALSEHQNSNHHHHHYHYYYYYYHYCYYYYHYCYYYYKCKSLIWSL